MTYMLLWSIIVCQRIVELLIARSNEMWMKEQGGKVIEESAYKWIVLTHGLFLIAIFVEAMYKHQLQAQLNQSLFILFVILQFLRFWCLRSLGRFWNTKIIVLPKVKLIRKGPYKYIRHPNYMVVGLEFLIIPLLFHAYISAILFPFLHIVLMFYRIPMEDRSIREYN